MAITYPGTLDTFTNPVGTNTLNTPDHAQEHSDANDAVHAIEVVVGTTAGTNVLKSFAAGDFPARVNSGGTIVQVLTGGTINGPLFGTAIQDHITSSGTTVPTVFDHALAPTKGTAADSAGGTLTALNAAVNQIQEVVFGTTAGNRTIPAPLNATDGQPIIYRFKTSANANGTLIWNAIFRFSTGTAGTATIGGSVSAWHYYGFRYNGTDTKWDDQGSSKNIL